MDACWNCGGPPGNGAFCDACGKVQPDRPRDHFAVLGLPRRFDLIPEDIEKRFRELQRKLHPDRFATKTAPERRMSLEHATSLNQAHRTLRDPVRRAEYLLELSGIAVPGEGAAGGTRSADPAFLMEVMEIREALERARREHDAARVQTIGRDAAREREASLSGIAGAFARSDLGPVPAQLERLRYFSRVLEEVNAIEETG